MIISHAHKFIFIKTAKTAGTSIEVFLSPHCGPEDVVTPIAPPVDGHQPRNHLATVTALGQLLRHGRHVSAALKNPFHRTPKFYNHIPAWQVRERVPRQIWNDYFKFCVERNPWDKVLSHYHMAAARADGNLSLDEYFRRGRFPLNYFRYTDTSGERIIVDRVIRYERLNGELTDVFSKLGVPFHGSLGVRAKSEYRCAREPASKVFSEPQRERIRHLFAREIALHGYEPEMQLSVTGNVP